jgi:hypothetical protein
VQSIQTKTLERQIRRLKFGFAICLVFSVLPWVLGQAAVPKMDSKKVIIAESFVLVDSKQKPRASLSMSTGEPTLSFVDKHGELRAVLGMNKGRTILQFFDSKQTTVVLLNSNFDEDKSSPYLVMSAPSGYSAILSVNEKESRLRLGENRLSLVAGDEGTVIGVSDKYGNSRLGFGEHNGVSTIFLKRADGTTVFHAP